MDHTVKNKHFPGVFEATPLRAPVRPWGHAPRQANPVLTQGRRGAQGRDTPPNRLTINDVKQWLFKSEHVMEPYSAVNRVLGPCDGTA